MAAVRKLEEAHQLAPGDPFLHYAWACGLALAMQYPPAKGELEKIVQTSPHFLLAKLAIEGWGEWNPPFYLPPWSPGTLEVHPLIASMVKFSILLPVRDGLMPRAALFFRDANKDLRNPEGLASVRVEVATVISSFTDPQVVGVYAKVWDDPPQSFTIEALGLPFFPRGHKERLIYELLCIQNELDFVVLDRNGHVLHDRRIPGSSNMKRANERLLKLLECSDGRQTPVPEMLRAMEAHRSRFSLDDVQY